jgi:hypothetical protein
MHTAAMLWFFIGWYGLPKLLRKLKKKSAPSTEHLN